LAPAASLNAGKAGISLHRNFAIASFSLDASIRVEGPDRAGLERLLRYCARPPFALERLEQMADDALIYRFDEPQPDRSTQLRHTPWN
jgi:hypothetical protein